MGQMRDPFQGLTVRVAGAALFWLEPEPFFWSGSGFYSYSYSSYSSVNILFLRDPK